MLRLIAAVTALYALTLLIVYIICFYSPLGKQNDEHNLPAGEQYEPQSERMHAMIDALRAIPYETVEIRSRDGLRLRGKYYPGRGADTAICFHGYRAAARRDFSGGARYLIGQGFNVLLVDQRAQGESEGRTITFGIRERFDCLAWAQYAAGRFGPAARITLYGISMGAATVLMASELDLPENVAGIVADCPYDKPAEIIRSVCAGMGLPVRLLWPLVAAAARLYGRFDPGEASASGAVRNARVPILILHGEDDRYVPCEMSARIAAANPALVRRYTFPGAAHGLSFLADPERYRLILEDFLRAEKTSEPAGPSERRQG
ncbi:MAG: alpha/beta hydrolase [Oscillospiraceae bacterium]|nr:alpha/beta hydrolase [Oscillospiraceae bacterium]